MLGKINWPTNSTLAECGRTMTRCWWRCWVRSAWWSPSVLPEKSKGHHCQVIGNNLCPWSASPPPLLTMNKTVDAREYVTKIYIHIRSGSLWQKAVNSTTCIATDSLQSVNISSKWPGLPDPGTQNKNSFVENSPVTSRINLWSVKIYECSADRVGLDCQIRVFETNSPNSPVTSRDPLTLCQKILMVCGLDCQIRVFETKTLLFPQGLGCPWQLPLKVRLGQARLGLPRLGKPNQIGYLANIRWNKYKP